MPATNAIIDRVLASPREQAAALAWADAARAIMADAGMVPLTENKYPVYHSTRTRNCVFSLMSLNCDFNAVWLEGAKSPPP